ncbi:TPR protein [Geosmithia morbida]|uniref:TPR protein n=1 Tax=Geosmithia morbida TaxID=1094350 RepID=A0A9P4YU84_9HYPO|nr:TPR protein [Geosmithia morbida]KAF4121124.1 TPR protein [Geosmithia morbida]
MSLDLARCEGNWAAVPELVRKVRKHAPERACLTLTAELECAVSNATNAAGKSGHAAAAAAAAAPDAADLDVAGKAPQLLQAIEKEDRYPEDRFQAQVCVGWMHWVVAEHALALTHLPVGLDLGDSQADAHESVSEWTTVCALKSVYLRANCLNRRYERKEALLAFRSGLQSLARVWSGRSMHKQLAYWAELYLTEYCMLTSQALKENDAPLDDSNSIASFRSWAKFWDVTSPPANGGFGFKGSVPRRRVWNEYYVTLSRILEEDLPFPTGYLSRIPNDASARAQLRAELKNVEAIYHGLLIKETSFPRAEEEREEVEAFVALAVQNWTVLCGRGWREHDLGPGGRNSLSRGVLDILYNAATKTFQSTAVLRSLFLVHLSVGEFDQAFRSFDSYLEIVKKGKARVDKTGHAELSLDDDATVLQTMAQAIIALCQYGPTQVAEKARQLGAELEDWLARLPQLKSGENGAPAIAEHEATNDLHAPIPAEIVALSWQAIGLSHAQWSRATHEASSRTEIQARAIRCLRRALAAEFGRAKDVRTYFTLGLLLAERRELTAAIEVVKMALSSNKATEAQYDLRLGSYWLERSLIPMWHLLALLLSARQDYSMASRACEGALEQFKDPSVLLGKERLDFRSEHLNEAEGSATQEQPRGLIDDMADSEKEAILEVKMTQLSLVELLEGPEVAVNASYELLALFTRLFGNLGVASQPSFEPPKASEAPKTVGTLRSLKGSILRRDKSRPPTRQPSNATLRDKANAPARPATSRTNDSSPPSTQVTAGERSRQPSRRESTGRLRKSESSNRNGTRRRDTSTSRRDTSTSRRDTSTSRRDTSTSRRDTSTSRHRGSSTGNGPPGHSDTVIDGESFYTPIVDTEGDQQQSDFFSSPPPTTTKQYPPTAFSRSAVAASATARNPESSEFSAEVLHASTGLLTPVQFSKDKERLQKTTILIRVWLMIAGFYRRAHMYNDCQGAASEAQKLVQAIEADSNKDKSTSINTKDDGWAERKSIDSLWGDVYTEFGMLSVARGDAHTARAEFEAALLYSHDHPEATVGLSNILLDVYSEKLLPSAPIFPVSSSSEHTHAHAHVHAHSQNEETKKGVPPSKALSSTPLGLAPTTTTTTTTTITRTSPATADEQTTPDVVDVDVDGGEDELPEPYKATRLPLIDRLAARERAYALLSGLTRLGTGWNHSEAWFALSRAYEESGQPDKAKEVLWWCIELEEARGVREWVCLGGGGYVL